MAARLPRPRDGRRDLLFRPQEEKRVVTLVSMLLNVKVLIVTFRARDGEGGGGRGVGKSAALQQKKKDSRTSAIIGSRIIKNSKSSSNN